MSELSAAVLNALGVSPARPLELEELVSEHLPRELDPTAVRLMLARERRRLLSAAIGQLLAAGRVELQEDGRIARPSSAVEKGEAISPAPATASTRRPKAKKRKKRKERAHVG